MRILYIAHRIPYPPNKGDKIRSFNMVKHLSARHDVHCACFVDEPSDMQYVTNLQEYCVEVVALPLNRKRASIRAMMDLAVDETGTEGFYRDRRMAKAIESMSARVGSFDAVLVYSSSMGQYAKYARAPRKILDFCDLDSRKWAASLRMHWPPKSWLMAAEVHRLAELEKKLYRRFDGSILIGEHEADDWDIVDRDRLFFVGNGVTLPAPIDDYGYDSNTVGFVGDLGYHPNQDAVRWFVRHVWQDVRARSPQATFCIAGRCPPRSVRRLAAVPGVRVVGAVPDAVKQILKWQVVVAPLRVARGIQNKVLEAMAAGRPVVATVPAVSGIGVTEGKHLLIGGSAQAFARQVAMLLADPQRCRVMGACARAYVAKNHDWNAILAPLERILGSAGDAEAGRDSGEGVRKLPRSPVAVH